MKSLDLFSGIGGFALGFHWAGIETAAFCEIEDYPAKVLEKNFPGVPIHRDIRTLNGEEYEGIEIVTGGFPCQPHSVAGKRKASADSRDLWGEMYRIICEAKPKWVVAENVPGLLSSESGRYFGRVLRDLAQAGYCVQWFCIPASALGAWHKRERIWIIANTSFPGRSCKETHSQHSNAVRQRHKLSKVNKHGKAELRNKQVGESNGFCSDVPNAYSLGLQAERFASRLQEKITMFRSDSQPRKFYPWATEPKMGRVVDGIPNRSHRIKGLGNAVVPQIPYLIGKAILEAEQESML